MKKIGFIFFLVLLNGSRVLSQQQLKLWYNKPSGKWTDALPIGNGRLGAMVFGGVAQDRIQFNEETLWTGEPRNHNKKGAYRYLSQIRQLLAEGKQKEAEQLAAEQFMGLKSNEGKKSEWVQKNVKVTSAASPFFNDSKWGLMQVPSYEGWESAGFEGLDGAVWVRRSFEIPDEWIGRELILDLNRVRDHDFTYINGKLVGSMESTEARRYVLPKDVLVRGKNVIAVLVLNYFDKGGIAGYKDTSRHIGIYPKGEEVKRVSLNGEWRYLIQDKEPPAVPRFQADYQPFGDLWLNFKGHDAAVDYRRELDISNATARTTYNANGVNYSREYFSSHPAQAIVVHLTADQPRSLNFEAQLNSPHIYSSTSKADNSTLRLSVKVRNGALKGESLLRVKAKGGKIIVQNDRIIIKDADDVTLILTAATNYRNYKDVSADAISLARKPLVSLAKIDYRKLHEQHVQDYRRYFNTLSIRLDATENEQLPTNERIHRFANSSDPGLVALYLQYGRYLLISSSRPGTQPANLQGIWNELLTPPWGSKYTTNINAEMNYWPAELLNVSEMHEPLFKMTEELAQAGKETAKEYYNAPGWVLHHNTDIWRGTAPINASNHGIWVTGGGWLSHHLWERYLFTNDKQFLRDRAYPIMKESARFFNSFLIRDTETNWLISSPSNSPEQGGLVAGPAMDHQIIRSLFKAVIHAAELLGTDKAFSDTLKLKLSQIAPDQIGKHGQLQEWLADIDDPNNKHRHVSHLWAVHPGNEINWEDTPELMKAAKQSLIYRGDAATGWSLGWKINLWARFKDGDRAFNLIKMLLSPAEKGGAGSYANLFDAHPPFQIDGNFGGAAGIGELLVQSHTRYVDILPALPSALANGSINGICTRGGFRLNIEWSNGKLQSLIVTSLAGNVCRLRYKDKTVSINTEKNKTYRFDGELRMLK